MLEELKNLNIQAGKEDLLFFIQNIIGEQGLTINDIEILCGHIQGNYRIHAKCLLKYCEAFGWIKNENLITLELALKDVIQDSGKLNKYIVKDTVKNLFGVNIFNLEMFFYDVGRRRTIFRNERFPLKYSAVRNMLISQGFFEIERSERITVFYVAYEYEIMLSKYIRGKKKDISLEQLQRRLEKNALAGEKAEEFVLKYEQRRLGKPISEKIKIISDIDVSAGYDIVSFESNKSKQCDRLIEVKAVKKDMGFFWSSNEYETAKLEGERYYLYLVDLSQIDKEDYSPFIICNPAITVMQSDKWLIETESFYIRSI